MIKTKILKLIAKKIVKSHGYKKNIITYYKTINDTAHNEFTGFNKNTIDDFLKECHKKSLEQSKLMHLY